MKTKYLSKEEREQGKYYYLKWATLNGLGFSFLGDTTVYLMAIHFGASNTQLGYLSALGFVSGLVLLILPRVLAGANLVSIHYYAWLIRGFICLSYGALLFLEGQVAVGLIMLIHTLFCTSRTFGTAVSTPIQQMLVTSANTGEIVVRVANRFQTTRFLSQFISFLLLSVERLSGILGYLTLMGLGFVMNSSAALALRHVPCREVVDYQRGQNVFKIFIKSMRDRERALTLFGKWHTLSLFIIFTFLVPFLRKFAGFAPNVVFLFTITTTLGTVGASYALRPFTDRIGSRPVLILASFSLVLVSIVWSMIPATTHWSLLFIMGFAAFFLSGMIMLLSRRLEIKSIPEKERMGYVSMMNFFSAIVSFGVGLFAGMLADLGEQYMLPGLNPYGLTFLMGAVAAMQNGILCILLEDPGSLSLRTTTDILFSTRNLRAFLDVYQFNTTADPVKRKATLLSIGKSDTSVAADEIRKILHNPLSAEKDEILRSLFAFPKPELLPDILDVAKSEYSYHRITALFALGAYPDERVERFLLDLLEHSDANVRSTAAKSLARLGNASRLDCIRKMARGPGLSALDHLNYVIALSYMDTEGWFLQHIFTMADHQKGAIFQQAVLALTARMLEFDPPLSDLYQEENIQETTGLQQLLEETKQLEPFFRHEYRLLEDYRQGHYADIWQWCRAQLPENSNSEHVHYLTQAIQTHDIHAVDKHATLAAVYFTYHLLLTHDRVTQDTA